MTSIEWTDRTWNPTTGCDKVSPGCASCYAVRDARRLAGNPNRKVAAGAFLTTERHPNGQLDWTGIVNLHEDRLLQPLSWRKPARIFVNSMSDLFHEDVPDAFIDRVFAVMALARQHTFQILTKRPERMLGYFDGDIECMLERWADAALTIRPLGNGENATDEAASRYEDISSCEWPLPNVWLGVSVENQPFADQRIPLVLQTPAAVRFISAEPLLGPVELDDLVIRDGVGEWHLSALECDVDIADDAPFNGAVLDWVIVGGESGPDARPFDLMWARSIVQQCQAAGVPVFVKQLGRNPISTSDSDHGLVDLEDRKGGDMAEWPDDLRVREFPTVEARRRHPNTVRT